MTNVDASDARKTRGHLERRHARGEAGCADENVDRTELSQASVAQRRERPRVPDVARLAQRPPAVRFDVLGHVGDERVAPASGDDVRARAGET